MYELGISLGQFYHRVDEHGFLGIAVSQEVCVGAALSVKQLLEKLDWKGAKRKPDLGLLDLQDEGESAREVR